MHSDDLGSRRVTSFDRGKWLAPAGTIVAMLTCYGITAALGLLSLVGITAAIPFRAPVIVLFSALALVGLAGSYRRHQSRPSLVIGAAGFLLVTASKFLPPAMKAAAIGLEGAGFLCLIGANILALRARQLAVRSCTVQCAS